MFNYIIKTGICVGGFLTMHYIIRKKPWSKNTKWYFIHFAGNMAIAALTLNDTILTTLNPLQSMDTIVSWDLLDCYQSYPIVIMSSLHIYHILVYFNEMILIDWIHHILNGFFGGSLCALFIKAPIVNHGLFFMCGLPGGIDYGLLFLDKLGYISRKTEKNANVYLNNWMRAPGIIFNCFTGYMNYIYTLMNYSQFVLITIFFLNMWNAIYFSERVTYNLGKYDTIFA